MAIYMQYPGIDGDATSADHKDWITCQSLQWGVGRAISTPTGDANNRECSEPSVAEVTISKNMDKGSTLLFNEACVGVEGKEVIINAVSTGTPGRTYLVYTLTNCLVSGYSISSGGETPSESVSINFTKVEMKYIPAGMENNQAGQIIKSYDLASTEAA